MKQKIITDNAGETITVKWDGERFGLVIKKLSSPYPVAIILNPAEMRSIIKFVDECKEIQGGIKWE